MTEGQPGRNSEDAPRPARQAMLAALRQHVRDERLLAAMAEIQREDFVPAVARVHAYDDRALPIGEGQTISQPLMVALMLEALALRGDERVLEVGTGSGYQTVLLSRLVRDVISIERVPSLLAAARERFADAGSSNVRVHDAGSVLGWPQEAPFDAIIVAAAAPHVPRALIQQLGMGGRMVVPVGGRSRQQLVRVTRTPHGTDLERLGACAFVLLIGAEAWPDDRAGP